MALKLVPYLSMNGNAKEAIDFYVQALDAQILFLQTYGEMPANPEFPMPEEAKGLIGHATIKIGESELMFSDAFPGQSLQPGGSMSICITTPDAGQAKSFFEALSQGGQVTLPLHETFFSPAYGTLTDKFGVNFQIYTQSSM